MINVAAYAFLFFSDMTCHLENRGIGVFCLHCATDRKENEFRNSKQETFPSAHKIC